MTDDTTLLEDGNTYDLSEVLYDARCGACYDEDERYSGEVEHFTLNADPDDPTFEAECFDCGRGYTLAVETVIANTWEPADTASRYRDDP